MKRTRFTLPTQAGFTVIAFLALAHPVIASDGTVRILHQSPTGTAGEPVSITVTLEGLAPDGASAMLHHRPQGASRYETIALNRTAAARWDCELPATATHGLSVSYYIEASSANGRQKVELGSPTSPLTVRLATPLPPAAATLPVSIPAGGLALCLIGGMVHFARRHNQRAGIERMFWMQTLYPLVHLDAASLAERLETLAEVGIEHPLQGMTRFSPNYLEKKLAAVRTMDLDTILNSGIDLGATSGA